MYDVKMRLMKIVLDLSNIHAYNVNYRVRQYRQAENKRSIKMSIQQMTRPRKGTLIPLAIVLLGSACAYMSADVQNPAPLFLSVCVMVFGVIVGILETSENKG